MKKDGKNYEIPACFRLPCLLYTSFGFASKKYHPLKNLREKEWNDRGIQTRYYTTTLHKGAFYLPAYVEELLKNVEKEC